MKVKENLTFCCVLTYKFDISSYLISWFNYHHAVQKHWYVTYTCMTPLLNCFSTVLLPWLSKYMVVKKKSEISPLGPLLMIWGLNSWNIIWYFWLTETIFKGSNYRILISSFWFSNWLSGWKAVLSNIKEEKNYKKSYLQMYTKR